MRRSQRSRNAKRFRQRIVYKYSAVRRRRHRDQDQRESASCDDCSRMNCAVSRGDLIGGDLAASSTVSKLRLDGDRPTQRPRSGLEQRLFGDHQLSRSDIGNEQAARAFRSTGVWSTSSATARQQRPDDDRCAARQHREHVGGIAYIGCRVNRGPEQRWPCLRSCEVTVCASGDERASFHGDSTCCHGAGTSPITCSSR